MRIRTGLNFLALGLGLGAFLGYRARRARRDASARPFSDFAPDPADPVQGFDEVIDLQVMPLDVDALSVEDAEAAQDLAALADEIEDDIGRGAIDVRGDTPLDDEIAGSIATSSEDVYDREADLVRPHDAGDLYGVHTPVAADRTHPDDDRAFDDGQNWIEALETSAVENGAEPERPLDDIVDDEDVLRAPHPSSRRDVPVADLGSGGRRGL
ncbi:MAG TPA: hypothetical protein VFP84_20270 [Kofleriaceae bacterium]|nr:hypothetical protein [Kofleriaceae bacterium]